MNRYEGIDEFIIKVIEKETAKLRGRFGYGEDDMDDLRQDLHAQVFRKLDGAFTPSHPQYKAAVRRTVDTRIKDVIEHRTAEKRKGDMYALHLEHPVVGPDGEETQLDDLLDLQLIAEELGGAQVDWHRRRHAALDIQDALLALPDHLHLLAETIDELEGNLSAVERELRITRKKLRCDLAKLREFMREFFEE